MNPIFLIIIFIIATVLGYLVIKKVPSLLHTPLMSGMNALSGITILGAIVAVGAFAIEQSYFLMFIAGIAVVLATINVVGGFSVTDRMLNMFNPKKKKKEDKQ